MFFYVQIDDACTYIYPGIYIYIYIFFLDIPGTSRLQPSKRHVLYTRYTVAGTPPVFCSCFFFFSQGLSWADAGGPARPMTFSYYGPRPDPARSGASNFQRMDRGPARPGSAQLITFFKFSRPGQAHGILEFAGPDRPGSPAHDKPLFLWHCCRGMCVSLDYAW